MSSRLHDLMEIASREARDRVVPADLAATTWRAGRARRRAGRRRTAVSTVAAVVALVAAVTAIGALRPVSSPAPAAPLPADGTYPERITRLGSTDPLPARPGRLAGLAERFLPETEGVLWTAITPTGLRWSIESDGTPTLSPDGRILVTLSVLERRIVVHDLVTGTSRTVTGVRPGTEWGAHSHFDAWSPDGTTLILRTPRDRARFTYHLLDVATAQARLGPVVPGSVIGVADDGTLTALRTTAKGTRTRGPTGTINRTSSDGRLISEVALDTFEVSTAATLWSATSDLSPDGARVALVDPGGRYADREDHPPAVLVFSATTGRLVSRTPVHGLDSYHVGDNATNRITWVHGQPVVSDRTGAQAAASLLVRTGGTERLVAVDPALHLSVFVWADDALSGGPVRARFGTTQAWWSWHTRTIGLVAGTLLLVVLAGSSALVIGRVRRVRR